METFDRAGVAERLAKLAQRGVYIGTSSWKYAGWMGAVYDEMRYIYRNRFSETRFNADCLREYAEVFPSVCVDAGYYRFPDERYLAKLAALVPDHFRLSFKVTDEITLPRFPNLPRFGDRAGLVNPDFLNPERFCLQFARPLSSIRDKVGVLIFEFSRFHQRDFEKGSEFVKRLEPFLAALPMGWHYGVEIRNRSLLRPEYFAILRKYGVTHVFNQWTRMPPIAEQLELEHSRTAAFSAARFLLTPGRTYEEAVRLFQPYTERKAPDDAGRESARTLIRDALDAEAASFVYVNNRFEGSAPLTIQDILTGIEF